MAESHDREARDALEVADVDSQNRVIEAAFGFGD